MEIAKVLIENNVNFETPNNGCTPFFIACQKGHLNIVKLLIQNNANIETPLIIGKYLKFNKMNPLMISCYQGHKDIVTHLLENNLDINIPSENGWAAFKWTEEGKKDMLENKNDLGEYTKNPADYDVILTILNNYQMKVHKLVLNWPASHLQFCTRSKQFVLELVDIWLQFNIPMDVITMLIRIVLHKQLYFYKE
eukprot:TRINITY_DN6277_c0_g2_i2.p1 TRINITY_DN6277_c0_g2~~TRINITY_DN6277_c0_g2_i2.p1  ORF type:complete len:195 (+),score=42.88 TRINITY_DN6277_c0_g2_i2:834-1418(+)